MAEMDDVAKKILKGRKLKPVMVPKSKVNPDLPPPANEAMKSQGKALKKAESTAPAKSETVKNSVPKNVKETKKAKRVIGGVLPEGASKSKPFNFKAPSVADDVFKAPAKKGVGKAIKRGAIAAGILGPVGLGVNALMEGLEADEAGGEEQDLEAASTRQAEKTAELVNGKKVKSLPASTKKRVAPPKGKIVFSPKPRSDESIVEGFNQQLDKNFGPEDEDEESSVIVNDFSNEKPARYRVKMKSKEKLDWNDKAKAVGIHSQLRSRTGQQTDGEIDIPEFGEKIKIRRRR